MLLFPIFDEIVTQIGHIILARFLYIHNLVKAKFCLPGMNNGLGIPYSCIVTIPRTFVIKVGVNEVVNLRKRRIADIYCGLKAFSGTTF